EFKGMRYVLRAGVFTVREGAAAVGEMRLVSMTLGGRVDLESPDLSKPGAPVRPLAIYTVSGNSLKMCVSLQPVGVSGDGPAVKPEGVKRPTRFGEPNSYVVEFKKIK
ncbi:hypothetical protein R5W23_006389, partial [Gemmata sp. JC673]